MEYKNVPTVCPYCGTGCSFYLSVIDGKIEGIIPSPAHPVSQGNLCIKGWTANEFVNHKDRLTKPLLKQNDKFVEIGWSEALNTISEKFKEYKNAPDSFGFLSSAKCTNEENYLLMKFARAVIGTNNVDHCARL